MPSTKVLTKEWTRTLVRAHDDVGEQEIGEGILAQHDQNALGRLAQQAAEDQAPAEDRKGGHPGNGDGPMGANRRRPESSSSTALTQNSMSL